MIIIQGKGVSKGSAMGTLRFFQRPRRTCERARMGDLHTEQQRLYDAFSATESALYEQAEQYRLAGQIEMAELFETHGMFLSDEVFLQRIQSILEKETCSAEYAVQQAGKQYADTFSAMDNDYMRERATDILDVSNRILDVLLGTETDNNSFDEPVILAADDLTPSETVRLDKSRIVGFALQLGSENSHTAILARNLGIPAICNLGMQLQEAFAGRTAFIDADTGTIVLDPDDKAKQRFKAQCEQLRHELELQQELKGKADITADGQPLMLYCNIASTQELPAVLENDVRGIGLFRSEFLFLARKSYPSEEEQYSAYKEAVQAMRGGRVIIRTLDIGADKQAPYLALPTEQNPAMGLRGIRVCLRWPEIFRTQLRAIYRASAFGKVAIMFPMIVSVQELRECLEICRQVREELNKEGRCFAEDTEIGVMIETPAAVLIADELAEYADFFSVGTNDLTQYLLACDRQNGNLDGFFDAKHPAVFRALEQTVSAAHRKGIWVGICGELAADSELLEQFVSMGVDELSVSPPMVLPLRAKLRVIHAKDGRA